MAELRHINIRLRLYELYIESGLDAVGPDDGVAITDAPVEIDVHVYPSISGDQTGIQPCGSGQFIPHVAAARASIRGQVLGNRCLRFTDFFYHLLGKLSFERDIDGGASNGRPMGAQNDVACFRIKPKIELVARVGGKFRISGLGIQTAAHEN